MYHRCLWPWTNLLRALLESGQPPKYLCAGGEGVDAEEKALSHLQGDPTFTWQPQGGQKGID